MAKKQKPNVDLARLHVLAAGDERAFLEHALALLASGDRLAREAALAALVERPLPAARDPLRALYAELDADGLKRDQGAPMRGDIVRILTAIAHPHDADIAARAADASEIMLGQDVARNLRAGGLILLARVAPDLFPYLAVEHLDDATELDSEPAGTAFQLLLAAGQHLPVYQWLIAADRDPVLVTRIFELFATDAPKEVVARYVERTLEDALRRQNEPLLTALAESVVRFELESAYPALAAVMSAKISDELYDYLALLLASTNRPPLLAVLEEQLHRGRHPQAIADALRVRTTPEQKAILARWESGAEA